jgi:Tfp pilus assembly protein PilN
MRTFTASLRTFRGHPCAPNEPRLYLEFSPTIGMLLRRTQVIMVFVSVLSVSLAMWWWAEGNATEASAIQIETATASLDATNMRLKKELAEDGLTVSSEHVTRVKRQVALANLLSRKRTFSWSQLLAQLDEAIPGNVSLNSVELKFQDSSVSLQGAVLSLHDLNALVEGLDRHVAFKSATVIDHRIEAVRDASAPRTPPGTSAKSGRQDNTIVFHVIVTHVTTP